MSCPPKPLEPGTVPLRDFLHAPALFVKHPQMSRQQCLSLEQQQSYLMAVFKKQKDTPRIFLRRTHNAILEVHEGWQYVDTLTRFFLNGIPMPCEIFTLFPNTFSEASVDWDGTDKSKSLGVEDRCYTGLDQLPQFRKFVLTADVPVVFLNTDIFNIETSTPYY